MAEPWSVRLAEANGFPLGKRGTKVQIANPASYLAQKLLVLTERKADKQPKDVLYIHDTLLIFADALPELNALWRSVEPSLHPRAHQRLHRMRAELDRVRNASVIARSTPRPDPPSPEQLAAAWRQGLERIFGG